METIDPQPGDSVRVTRGRERHTGTIAALGKDVMRGRWVLFDDGTEITERVAVALVIAPIGDDDNEVLGMEP